MKIKFLKVVIAACGLLFNTFVSANVIGGGAYLDQNGAVQLQAWLGVGNQDFTSIWSGESGELGDTAASWHTAVDYAGPTVSIYEMTIPDGSTAYIGGYTGSSWAGNSVYKTDPMAFIFNLTSGEIQRQVIGDSNDLVGSIFANNLYFATFGSGHDIYGGFDTLGSGYFYSYGYEISKGSIGVTGDAGTAGGDSGYEFDRLRISGLRTFTFEPATVVAGVSAPPTIAILALSLLGLASRRFKK